MGAPEVNTTLLYGFHTRESANDGSDFTNAAADYRIIFLGEDGELHAKDSSGSVTGFAGTGISPTILDAKGDLIAASAADTPAKLTAGANGSILQALSSETTGLKWNAAPVCAAYTRTSGNYTTTSTSFVDVDGTNTNLTITTLARRVRVNLSAVASNSDTSTGSVTVDLDGSNLGNSLTSGSGGIQAFRSTTANHPRDVSFSFLTDVLSAGSHTFKLQWAVGAGTGTLMGGSAGGAYLRFSVEETLLTA